MKRIVPWILAHKIKTVLLSLLLVLLVELATIPWFGVATLMRENPAETALMRQRKKEAERDGMPYRVDQQWVPLSRIPKQVLDAIVVAEDGTFFTHQGFDWYEVQESVAKNLEKGRAVRGASTITQQLAKNLYLSTSKDPVRKVKEAIITVLMERFLTKGRILELYVNCIEWGRGIFGIEAASRRYFGKPAASLSLQEGARLAAVIPSPLKHRPDSDSRYVVRRSAIVLNRLAARTSHTLQQQEETPSSPTEEDDLPATEDTDTLGTDEGDGNGL
jgi:monofunctional biosynthetic peptidoglycan transglycosylase